MQRECRRLISRPLYLFCMVIAPLFCYIFFTTLMDSGLPKDLPAGVVDMDDSSTSRNIVRNLDAFSQTGVVAHYSNVTDARIAMQEGKIYGFFYLPKGLSAEAQSQRQPTISFYTNYSYLIAGSLLFRDMKMMGELTSGAAARVHFFLFVIILSSLRPMGTEAFFFCFFYPDHTRNRESLYFFSLKEIGRFYYKSQNNCFQSGTGLSHTVLQCLRQLHRCGIFYTRWQNR